MVKSDNIFDEEAESGTEKRTEDGEIDVYSPAEAGDKGGGVVRDDRGRWLPGHAPKPPGRKPRSKAQEYALLTALDDALPSELFAKHMKDAIKWAYEYKSPRLLMQLWEFRFNYTIGTPVQRSITATGKLENLLSRLTDMDEDQFQTVEAAMRGDE